jgi:hypothetical protein
MPQRVTPTGLYSTASIEFRKSPPTVSSTEDRTTPNDLVTTLFQKFGKHIRPSPVKVVSKIKRPLGCRIAICASRKIRKCPASSLRVKIQIIRMVEEKKILTQTHTPEQG